MEQVVKQRLVGLVVIVILAVIFIPMLLDNEAPGPDGMTTVVQGTPGQAGQSFDSRVIPLAEQKEFVAPEPSPGQAAGGDEAGRLPMVGTRGHQPLPAPQASIAPAPAGTATTKAGPGKESGTTVASKAEPEKPAAASAAETWVVQVGSFATRVNAEKLRERLSGLGFKAYTEQTSADDGSLYRVRIGPFSERSVADSTRAKLEKTAQIKGIVVHP